MIDRYRNKISGPLLDRIDMHLEVPALRYSEMMASQTTEDSSTIRQRVEHAREVQRKRLGAARCNSTLGPQELKKHAALSTESAELMRHAIDVMGISVRAHDRILRVARTIADLQEESSILEEHLMEAIGYRSQVMNDATHSVAAM
jgi:magnesium chelatase family protein